MNKLVKYLKITLIAILCLSLSLLFVACDKQVPSVTDFDYMLVVDKVIITGYNGSDIQVEIPATIDNKEVVAIGDNAFRYNTDITNIKIPNSVKSIGEDAFYDCKELTKVEFANGSKLTSIGDYAFYNCLSLSDISMPNSLVAIGYYAFYNCTGLTQITLPNSVEYLAHQAFSQCSNLQNITIGSGLKSVGEDAFWGCGRLQKVYITDLSAWCNIDFANADSNPLNYCLESLYINGTKTTNLVIPADVKQIKDYAFVYSNIDSLSFAPNSQLEVIGQNAFESSELSTVALPQNGKSITIKRWAFGYCHYLENIVIPINVEIMEWNVFGGAGVTIVFCEAASKPAGWSDFGPVNYAAYYWYSENTPITEGNYWKYVDGVPIILQSTGPSGIPDGVIGEC